MRQRAGLAFGGVRLASRWFGDGKRIKKVVPSTGETTVCVYEGDGQRIKKVGPSTGETTVCVYEGDGSRVKKILPAGVNGSSGETTVCVYDASGKLVAEYSTIVEPQATAKTSYLTNDHLGSPRITTDAVGQVASRQDFMPYGEEIFSPQRTQSLGYAADTIRRKFTSYERDNEISLDFAQTRMYNVQHGRFSGVDPYNIIFEADNAEKEKEGEGQKLFNQYISQPQNWNRYVYVWNNPLRYLDPDGEKVYVILYTVGNLKGDDEFRRGAETRAKDIRNSKGFDPKKDIVLVEAVRTVEDVQSALKMANALDGTWGKVQQVALVSHGGPIDGPAFQHGTDNETWATKVGLANVEINWAKDGEAFLLGCNTAVNFAQTFADRQGVNTWGFTTGTSFYSESNPKLPKGSGIMIRPLAYDYLIFNTPLYMKSQGNNPNGNFVKRTPRRY